MTITQTSKEQPGLKATSPVYLGDPHRATVGHLRPAKSIHTTFVGSALRGSFSSSLTAEILFTLVLSAWFSSSTIVIPVLKKFKPKPVSTLRLEMQQYCF